MSSSQDNMDSSYDNDVIKPCSQKKKYMRFFCIAFVIIVFGWEYALIHQEDVLKPSIILNKIADKAIAFWEWLGHIVAWVSSFLHWFNFEDALLTASNLFEPLVTLFWSWIYFIKGYTEQMDVYEHPYMVIFGSIMIVIASYISYKKLKKD